MFRDPDSGASPGTRGQLSRLSTRGSAAASVLLGAVLAGIAFGAAGGTELTRTSIVEILMVLLSGVVVSAAVLWGARGPLHGAAALLAFALLAFVTALSVTWAIVPALAYVEAGRTLAYLGVFAAGIAGARLAAHAGPAVICGILLAAMAAVAYALAARVWPASLGELEISNRIGQPFEYWNAVGTTAALAIPGLAWLGARRGAALWTRALAYPGMGAAILAILLTQSRGALAAAALGVIAWLALVPLRLRTLPVLLLPAVGAGAVGAWALSKPAFAETAQPLAVKEEVAGQFGWLLMAMVAVLLAAGLAVNLWLTRSAPPPRLRRAAGIAALGAAGLLAIAALGALALSDRGLGGTISDRVDELTSETETAPTVEGAGRLTATESTRSKYWKEARLVFEDRPAVGTGAGTFRVARLRHRTDPTFTGHAHGYVPQTLADLGLVGLAVSMLLLVAWLVAAARATSLYPRRLALRRGREVPPRRDWTAERIALVALALIALVFGLQSAIDWTWFVPGPAAMALVAAGFVAGRGPGAAVPAGFAATAERRTGAASPPPAGEGEAPAAVPSPGEAYPAVSSSGEAPAAVPSSGEAYPAVSSGEARPGAGPSPPRLLAAAGVLLAALLAAWAIWQPEASDRATGNALTLLDENRLEAALAEIEDARDANPLSSEPLLVKAVVETRAGREGDAAESLEEAVLKFPGEPDTWYRLAAFRLGTLDRPAGAERAVRGALYLDPLSAPARQLFLDARARLREKLNARAARSD